MGFEVYPAATGAATGPEAAPASPTEGFNPSKSMCLVPCIEKERVCEREPERERVRERSVCVRECVCERVCVGVCVCVWCPVTQRTSTQVSEESGSR